MFSEANEQIDQGAENPLEQAISALRTSEDAILRKPRLSGCFGYFDQRIRGRGSSLG